MTDASGIWLLEHSKRQNTFHIHTLGQACKSNLEMFMNDGDGSDFVPLGFFPTAEEANQFADAVQKRRANRRH